MPLFRRKNSERDGEPLASRMARLSDVCIETARGFGFELDHSPESLATVDRMVDDLWQGQAPDNLEAMVQLIGAYVGETLRRNLGGEWGISPEFNTEALNLPSGTSTFPLAKVEKRLVNGQEDSVEFYFQALSGLT